MSSNNYSVLKELWNSFIYFLESKKGKYSLSTYLDIVGEYTDRLILKAEEEGGSFLGGTCEVRNNMEDKTFDFTIKMYFQNSDGENISKEAKRCLPKERFTSETEQEIRESNVFAIHRPE